MTSALRWATRTAHAVLILIFFLLLPGILRLDGVFAVPPPGRPAPPPAEKTAPGADAEAQRLLESVLKAYGAYKDFQARFVETPVSRATGEGTPETGLVSYRRPDLWRWHYQTPERKTVLVRGKTAVITSEGESEPTRYDLDGSGEGSGIGRLLSGGADVSRSFLATELVGSRPKEEVVLRLRPVALSDEYDSVTLRVRRKDLTILQVDVLDPGGNALRFEFTDLRPNQNLSQALFDLPPSPPAQAREP